MSESVRVDLAGRAYDIRIGSGLLAEAGAAIRAVVGDRRLIVISDTTVAGPYLPALEAALQASGRAIPSVILLPGEDAKEFARFPALADRVLDLAPDRKTVLVALGGGVIGDLTGFLAATLLRGLDFIQIPTTLLAQIDSSVGGKTGTNTRHGKNLVGAFHQPVLVLADLDLLATLPRRELLSGYAEMVKYGLLGDATFFARLEATGLGMLNGEPAGLAAAVAHCCRMKAKIVAADERESGQRALLNLGHTFGHALEAETGFGPDLLHGEAVAIGIVLAARLSAQLGRIDDAAVARITRHVAASGLPAELSRIPGHPFAAARLLDHMRLDKKAEGGQLTFVVLDAIGRASVARQVEPDTV